MKQLQIMTEKKLFMFDFPNKINLELKADGTLMITQDGESRAGFAPGVWQSYEWVEVEDPTVSGGKYAGVK